MKLLRTQLIPIITDILNSCIELEKAGVSATGPNKILRETLHFIWEVSEIKKYDDKRLRSEKGFLDIRKNLAYDHPIPMKIILSKLKSTYPVKQESVEAVLQKYLRHGGVLITKGEHDLLRDIGLASKMPSDWDGEDIFARYKKAGISIKNMSI